MSSDGSTHAATGDFTSSGDAELFAIVAGLELGVESRSKSFALLTDSLDALAFAVQRAAGLSEETSAAQLEGIVDEVTSVVRATRSAEAPRHSMKRVVVSPLP